MPESLSCSFVCALLLLNVQIDSISGVVTQAAALLALTSCKVLFYSKPGSCSKQLLWIGRRLFPGLLEGEHWLCFEEKTTSSAWFLVLSPALKSRKLVWCWFEGFVVVGFLHTWFWTQGPAAAVGRCCFKIDKVLLLAVEPKRTQQELHVLHMPRNYFQHCLFHHLTRSKMTCHFLGPPFAFFKDGKYNNKGTENVCIR